MLLPKVGVAVSMVTAQLMEDGSEVLPQEKLKTMFGVFVLLTVGFSVCVGQNSSTDSHSKRMTNSSLHQMFAKCPDAYKHFCFSGTCRYLVLEDTPACICFKGFIGSRCESMDLLQIMAGNPNSIMAIALAVTILVLLSLVVSVGIGVYCCRQKRDVSQLTLLNNSDV